MNSSGNWHNLLALNEIEKADITETFFKGIRLAIYDTIDGIYISDARCSHAAANLCHGYFDGKTIECPLHQGLFDAKTGEPKAAPATRSLKMYETRIKDGMIQIKTG